MRPLRKVRDAPAHRPRLTGSMMNQWCLHLIGGYRLQVWAQISRTNGFKHQHVAEILTCTVIGHAFELRGRKIVILARLLLLTLLIRHY